MKKCGWGSGGGKRERRTLPAGRGVDVREGAAQSGSVKTGRLILAAAALACAGALAATERVRLTAYERAQGWRLLFDGGSLSDWRAADGAKRPANWQVVDGVLMGRAGPALLSAEEFGDFELSFDWRVQEGGRGEVFFRVARSETRPEESGPVMELAGWGGALGGNGGVTTPERVVAPQFGVWFRAKISVFGNLVEYRLQGDRVMNYLLDTAEWRAGVAQSRFAGRADYGRARTGVIALAGDGVEFRNIKVRATER